MLSVGGTYQNGQITLTEQVSVKNPTKVLVTFLDNEGVPNVDIYPFKPDVIKFEDKIYVLNKKLACAVDFEEDNYTIRNEFLDITVWGDTREEVETAFSFSFHALYENYALEDDKKLSKEAKVLKINLLSLVRKTSLIV
jgi:hypothetical protein